jgi:hypothetical protein
VADLARIGVDDLDRQAARSATAKPSCRSQSAHQDAGEARSCAGTCGRDRQADAGNVSAGGQACRVSGREQLIHEAHPAARASAHHDDCDSGSRQHLVAQRQTFRLAILRHAVEHAEQQRPRPSCASRPESSTTTWWPPNGDFEPERIEQGSRLNAAYWRTAARA